MATATAISVHLPEDVLLSILVRLPVKSLIRFRCVCKPWNALIRNPSFISSHLKFNFPDPSGSPPDPSNHAASHRLLATDWNSFALFSGDGFSRREQLDFPPHRRAVSVAGYCRGVLCVAVDETAFFFWNPATMEYKTFPGSSVPPPDGRHYWHHASLGFDPGTGAYKAVRILQTGTIYESFRTAEVYSLSTDSWKEIAPPSAFLSPAIPSWPDKCLNGFIFWYGISFDAGGTRYDVVLFDVAGEGFRSVDLPPEAARRHGLVTKFDDVSIACIDSPNSDLMDVWVMSDFGNAGARWVRQYSVNTVQPPLGGQVSPLGFWKGGELVLRYGYPPQLGAYCPVARMLRNLDRVNVTFGQFLSYRESLVPLGGKHVHGLAHEPFFSNPFGDADEGVHFDL